MGHGRVRRVAEASMRPPQRRGGNFVGKKTYAIKIAGSFNEAPPAKGGKSEGRALTLSLEPRASMRPPQRRGGNIVSSTLGAIKMSKLQ